MAERIFQNQTLSIQGGHMDSIDRQIITILQKNARSSISEISSRVNLSIPATSDRIRKIEAAGIITQYTAIVNAAALNMKLTAMMFVSLEKPHYSEHFVSFVNTQDEILECHYLAGDFDYLMKIVTESTESLERLLTRIKSVPGIQKTQTIVTLCTVKNVHSVLPHEPE